jgi:CubicO group peptidase (beta-lactamase class C family)
MEFVAAEAAGFSAERLAQINPVMQAYVDEQKLPGLITLLARRGKVVHFEQFGLMDMEANKPMQADAIFRIASMTKPIATVAAMMLYEKGNFQLSDPVSKFIDGFGDLKVKVGSEDESEVLVDLDREVTMHDLLTHLQAWYMISTMTKLWKKMRWSWSRCLWITSLEHYGSTANQPLCWPILSNC